MKLVTSCKNCSQEIKFFSWAGNRPRLAQKRGEEFELKCPNCKAICRYHVDEVSAEENKVILILALVVFFLGTPLIVYQAWGYLFRLANIYAIGGLVGVVIVPFLIFTVISRSQEEKVRNFNRYKIKDILR
jgi:hypothetical protein